MVAFISSDSDRASSALVTPRQAARELPVSDGTIRRWLHEGRLEGFRVGGRLWIERQALEACVQSAGPSSEEST